MQVCYSGSKFALSRHSCELSHWELLRLKGICLCPAKFTARAFASVGGERVQVHYGTGLTDMSLLCSLRHKQGEAALQ